MKSEASHLLTKNEEALSGNFVKPVNAAYPKVDLRSGIRMTLFEP